MGGYNSRFSVKFSDRQKKSLASMWNSTEFTVKDIARRFSVSGETIKKMAKDMGLPPKEVGSRTSS